MMLMTPAIASEPYCADDPSRSTSTRWIAAAGNRPKSTACAPWLTVPNGSVCRFTSAERTALAVDQHQGFIGRQVARSEEHTSELQSLMRISYAVFCLKKN